MVSIYRASLILQFSFSEKKTKKKHLQQKGFRGRKCWEAWNGDFYDGLVWKKKTDWLILSPTSWEKIRWIFTKGEIYGGIVRDISWLQGSANKTGSFPLGHLTVPQSYFPKMM